MIHIIQLGTCSKYIPSVAECIMAKRAIIEASKKIIESDGRDKVLVRIPKTISMDWLMSMIDLEKFDTQEEQMLFKKYLFDDLI